jgi:hypothetical protein
MTAESRRISYTFLILLQSVLAILGPHLPGKSLLPYR